MVSLYHTSTFNSQTGPHHVSIPEDTLYSNQEYAMYAIINLELNGIPKQVKINFPNFTTQSYMDIIPLGNIVRYIPFEDALVLETIKIQNQTTYNINNISYAGNITCSSLSGFVYGTYEFTDMVHDVDIISGSHWKIPIRESDQGNTFRFVCDDIQFKTTSSPYIPLCTNNVQHVLVFKHEEYEEFRLVERNFKEHLIVTHNYAAMINNYNDGITFE